MSEKDEMNLRDYTPKRAWYVIHTYSGYENKVKANLERLIQSTNMGDMIFNVVVPIEEEVELKDGKERVVPRKVFPGYVLVDMIVDERSWYVVRNTTGVTGFVGSEKKPIPLTEQETEKILSGLGKRVAKRATNLKVGDSVRILLGAFENYTGTVTVESINEAENRLQVNAEGRLIDLEIDQVVAI